MMGLGGEDSDLLFGFRYFGLLVGVGLGISMGSLFILVIFVWAILFCELVFTISSFEVAPPLFIHFIIIFLHA